MKARRNVDTAFFLALALTAVAGSGCVKAAPQQQPATSLGLGGTENNRTVIRVYSNDLSGIRAANPAVKLRIDRDAALPEEPVLIVEYPAATKDPAARDVRPNPFFQPPDARTGAPIDVGEVNGIGFAPQDSSSGRFAITQFVLRN